jgi:chaperonin GroES
MNFQPLESRVLVKVIEEEQKTASGIYIPDSSKEKPNRAEVKAIGQYIKSVEVGDTVVFGKYGGVEIELEGEDYLILEIKDIFGVIK